jgi:hypothetical protein
MPTQTEYYAEVKSLASSLIDAWNDGSIDERHEIMERLHEDCDGHEYVIYTRHAQEVACISENDGYAAENFGKESIVDEDGIKWSAVAFGCLYADTLEEIARQGFDVNDPPERVTCPHCKKTFNPEA